MTKQDNRIRLDHIYLLHLNNLKGRHELDGARSTHSRSQTKSGCNPQQPSITPSSLWRMTRSSRNLRPIGTDGSPGLLRNQLRGSCERRSQKLRRGGWGSLPSSPALILLWLLAMIIGWVPRCARPGTPRTPMGWLAGCRAITGA
jgi:hypothetical protein